MDNFLIALLKSMLGTGWYDDDHAPSSLADITSRLHGVVCDIRDWTLKVEAACFHAGIHWEWRITGASIGLTVYGDDEDGVVSRALSGLLDGYSMRYLGDGDPHDAAEFARDDVWAVEWEDDVTTPWGWATLKPVPLTEYDGVVMPEWDAEALAASEAWSEKIYASSYGLGL